MKTKNEEQASANERLIPTPPGGGSWTFDREQWDWVSNDPAPAGADAVEVQLNTNIEQGQ
jgi:hypothetical protein